MYLTKLRSVLKWLSCTHLDVKKYSTSQDATRVLANYFGYDDEQTRGFIIKHKLQNVNHEQLNEVIKLFDRYCFMSKDVALHGKLLRRTPRIQDSYYVLLQEAGFSSVSPAQLAFFRRQVHRKIKTLKTLRYIPQHVNVPEVLVSHLTPRPVELDISEFSDDDILSQVHGKIVKQYLMQRLEATKDEIETFFRVYTNIKFKSLRHLSENIILAIQLGFTPRKLLNFGYLVTNYPEYPKVVLETMPHLAGSNMRKSMRSYPKLVTVPPWHFTQIYKMLQDADITDDMIQRAMNIFTLAPDTVKLRLNEIKSTPELKVLLNNPNVLRLIVHHNRVKSRLSFLEQLQLKCASLLMLGFEKKQFDYHIKKGRDYNNLSEIINLLKSLLKCEKESIAYHLTKHPFHRQVALTEIERTVLYLQNKSYSNAAIVNVMPIVLYSVEKIETAFKLSHENAASKKLSDSKRLNLALYYMEKEHHFTGNGVWRESKNVE